MPSYASIGGSVWRCQQQIPKSVALALPRILSLAAFASPEIAAHHPPHSLPTDTGLSRCQLIRASLGASSAAVPLSVPHQLLCLSCCLISCSASLSLAVSLTASLASLTVCLSVSLMASSAAVPLCGSGLSVLFSRAQWCYTPILL